MGRNARGRTTRRNPVRASALIGAVAAIALGVLGVAAAAQLEVQSPDLSEFWDSPCSHNTLSVRVQPQGIGANKTSVQITNVPSACYGSTFQVGVSNSAGTLLASGSAVCSSASCTIPTGSYNAPSVADAHALVATWGIPTTWTTTCTFILFFWYCA